MSTGIVLLNFGEPPEPIRNQVVEYLTRIYRDRLEDEAANGADGSIPVQQLAEQRAPGLVEEYEAIGGSPLNEQAVGQADALEAELRDRGHTAVTTYTGMQFTSPFIDDAVEQAKADEIDTLVGLPIYPLCGPSTTHSALRDLQSAVTGRDWTVNLVALTSWHRHPRYIRLRTENIRSFVRRQDFSLADETTELVFAAHGTPQHYIESGSQYEEYVTEWCDTVSNRLGLSTYTLGYQNHDSRDVEWTEPAIEDSLANVDAERLVVEPISFMHEQSETLCDLDIELRDEATDAGFEFYRVPIPYDNPEFPVVLADLVEPFVADSDPSEYGLQKSSNEESIDAFCL